MKVIIEDFYYKDKYIDRYVCSLPQIKEYDDLIIEQLAEYIKEILDETFA